MRGDQMGRQLDSDYPKEAFRVGFLQGYRLNIGGILQEGSQVHDFDTLHHSLLADDHVSVRLDSSAAPGIVAPFAHVYLQRDDILRISASFPHVVCYRYRRSTKDLADRAKELFDRAIVFILRVKAAHGIDYVEIGFLGSDELSPICRGGGVRGCLILGWSADWEPRNVQPRIKQPR